MEIDLELSRLPQSGNFLQSPFWGSFKKRFGWESYPFLASFESKKLYFLALNRKIGRFFSVCYVPQPLFEQVKPEQRYAFLKELSCKMKKILPASCVAVKWDLAWPEYGEAFEQSAFSLPRPFKKAFLSVQPQNTVIIGLEASEEELLAAMHKKTRYNIGLAQKKGVQTYSAGLDELPRWYELYKETARRDKISIHSLEYYQNFFHEAASDSLGPEARLYMAKHDNDTLAGMIALFYGRQAVYVYGASSSIKRNLMPAYALQWHAIKEAKKRQCASYDLFGIPPANDPAHPMHGLYQFKTGFGGSIVRYAGLWDYPLRPAAYQGLRAAEFARALRRQSSKKTRMLKQKLALQTKER